MKVTRQNINEEYNTTVDWVNDFGNDLEKNADFLSNLKSIFKSRSEKFSTIDEKMADIRNRVGFDLIKDIDGGSEIKTSALNKEASSCGAEKDGGNKCGPCSTGKSCECGTGHGHKNSRKEKLDSIVELLRYIQDTVKSEPHLDEPIILDRCRKEKSYGLENINDMSKLKDFISNAVSTGRPVSVKLEYVPQEPISSSESMFDDTADYYQHGLVGAE